MQLNVIPLELKDDGEQEAADEFPGIGDPFLCYFWCPWGE